MGARDKTVCWHFSHCCTAAFHPHVAEICLELQKCSHTQDRVFTENHNHINDCMKEDSRQQKGKIRDLMWVLISRRLFICKVPAFLTQLLIQAEQRKGEKNQTKHGNEHKCWHNTLAYTFLNINPRLECFISFLPAEWFVLTNRYSYKPITAGCGWVWWHHLLPNVKAGLLVA